MPDKENIITELKCQNIAPIEDLTKEIKSGSLKMAVFANNGSGKTFLSRLFRRTENQERTALDENGKSPTDKLLTFGKDSDLLKAMGYYIAHIAPKGRDGGIDIIAYRPFGSQFTSHCCTGETSPRVQNFF